MTTVTTARGRILDFDLLRVRAELMTTEPTGVVVERQEAIEDQIRRRREQRRVTRERSLAKKAELDALLPEPVVDPVEEPADTIAVPKKPRTRINTESEGE